MEDPITLLFVDDDPAVLRTIRRQLIGDPFEVVMASSADEALAIMGSRRVDLLVSDIDMPEMNGIDLLLLARQRHPDTLRMLLTGAATLESTFDAINHAEVARLLTKPFDPESFRAILEGLGDRIESNRKDQDLRTGEARREHFIGWVERRYPGITSFVRDGAGRLFIDLPERLSAADIAGSEARDALFQWTCGVPDSKSHGLLGPPSGSA